MSDTELYPMPFEFEILKLLLLPGYRIRTSGTEEFGRENVIDQRGVQVQALYSGFVARGQKHGLIQVVNGAITFTDYGLSKRGILLASGRNGNEPALPQKQSNEPQLGGFRRVIKYKKGTNKMPTRIIHVVGVTFDGRQEIIAKMSGNEAVRLQPEPLNTYDKNAVAVIATLKDGTEAHIGYVSKSLAWELAPMMAAGQQVVCSIRQISGGFELQDGSGELANYGVELTVGLPEATV